MQKLFGAQDRPAVIAQERRVVIRDGGGGRVTRDIICIGGKIAQQSVKGGRVREAVFPSVCRIAAPRILARGAQAGFLRIPQNVAENLHEVGFVFDGFASETVLEQMSDALIFFVEISRITDVDPFDKDGQFIDRGHNYTLALFYLDEDEKNLYFKKIKEVEEKSNKKAYIDVIKYDKFYLAEDEHQDFALRNRDKYLEELVISGRIKK